MNMASKQETISSSEAAEAEVSYHTTHTDESTLASVLLAAGIHLSKPNRHTRRAAAAQRRAKSFSFLQED